MDPRTDCEDIFDGIQRSWLDENRIVCYDVTSLGPNSLVPWRNAALDALRSWPTNRPYLALHDLSAKGISVMFLGLNAAEIFNIGITEIGQTEAEKILLSRPDLRSRLAVVVSARTSGNVAGNLGRKHASPRVTSSETKLFFERDAAIKWLRELITT